MLDITLFRDPTTLATIKDSETRRFRDPSVVDRVVEADRLWLKATYDRSACSRVLNIIGRLIGQKKKSKEFSPD